MGYFSHTNKSYTNVPLAGKCRSQLISNQDQFVPLMTFHSSRINTPNHTHREASSSGSA